MSDDDFLTVNGRRLHADDTDEQVIEALSGLSFIYSPLMGLEGGDLGRLERDIRSGRLTLPGRSRWQSLDLVAAAVPRARDRQHQLRRDELVARWRQRVPVIAVHVCVLIVATAMVVFGGKLLGSSLWSHFWSLPGL